MEMKLEWWVSVLTPKENGMQRVVLSKEMYLTNIAYLKLSYYTSYLPCPNKQFVLPLLKEGSAPKEGLF